MQRRTIIKQLAFASGALLLIPSCMEDKSKASILLNKIRIDGDQEKLLAELAETIIPKTDNPGAKDVSAHLFVLMMVDDCYKQEDQQKFMAGLEAFHKKSKKEFSKSFIDCTQDERARFLTDIDGKKSGDDNLDYFYATVKKLTIQGYTTSKYFLTKVQVYQLIPGHFSGCVPVKNAS
ncbi:MAG: gluconate 2-dehydrogenase subunit 3 family protein [Lacibacter sp.]